MRAIPRWARWAAHGAALAPLPSGLWRIAWAAGVPVGFTVDMPAWGPLYMVTLSVLAEGLGLLALGLVQPWGEVFPRWLPLLGGRRVPVLLAVLPASLGAAALVAASVDAASGWSSGMAMEGAPTGVAAAVMAAAYAPLLLWGPCLAVATVGYAMRRLRPVRAAMA